MKPRIKNLINNLKDAPGVYLMHDANDNIIYIGKAKNLKKRVSQYFLRPQSGKVMKMVQEAEWFETIITSNEKEALILEMNLIQTHYPKFNILLKDDKHYPYIAIKKGSDPYLSIKRNNKDNKYRYFGPFPNSSAAYDMVGLLNKLFPLRKCKNIPNTPCLYYHLGQCLGPCINKNIPISEYEVIYSDINDFLKGNNKKKYDEIKQKMLDASSLENYELALSYKKILESIEHINTKQTVELNDRIDRDVFAFSTREHYFAMAVLIYRNGVLLGKNHFVNEIFDNPIDMFENMICQFYQKYPSPKEIVINLKEVKDDLSNLLDANIVFASKGRLLDLVEKTKINADNALDEYFVSARLDEDKLALLELLADILKINTPFHIDLFDNSHIQGTYPVGVMVSFINGEPCKKLYRKFKIEGQDSKDDIKSMEQVIYRHYKRVKEDNGKIPNLILVDGGLTQVKAARKVVDELHININVFGLYKNNKHQTEGVIDCNGEKYIIENKNLFFLLTRMQDEVHRFAITFHQNSRSKGLSKSILDDIRGLGNKRKELIRQAYSDINVLKQASIDELSQLVPKEVAAAIYEKLHK